MKKFYIFCLFVVTNFAAFSQLSGTYTIDVNGSGTSNYASFTAAVTALSANGVNGPVVFNVASGTYTEQVTFESYSGVSHVNTITFQSDPGNASSPVLTFAPTSSAIDSNFTARFNGAKYIILDGLTIETSGTSYGRLFNIAGTTNQSLTIQNCTLTGYSGSTSSSFAIFYMSAARFDTLTIDNNTITNGSYMGYFYGSSSNMSEQFVFTNNTVTGFMSYGVYTGYVNSGEISHNTIAQSSTSSTFCYGVRLYGLSTNSSPGYWEVHDNDISIPSYGYGMYLFYVYGSASNPNKIYNNAVVFGSGTSYNYGIYMYHPSNLEVFNNTIRTGTAYSSNRPVYASASTSSSYPAPSVSIKNNIFANDVQGYPMYFYVSSVFSSSYIDLGTNVFYTPTTGVSGYYYGTTSHSSFAAYQAASGDSTSMFADPIFTGADYHVEGLAPNAAASVIPYISTDLDGDSRDSLTPDIGADEFLPPACPRPSGTSFGAITPYTAAMSWLGTSTAYEIEYGPTGFVQGTGSTATATSTSTTLAVNPATTYDVYIRANCLASGNGYSGWYGPTSFTTLCQAATMPYSDDFQNWSSTSPLACWDIDNGTKTVMLYTDAASNNSMRFNFWSWTAGNTGIATSRPVYISSAATVSFDWSHSNQYYTSYNDQMTLRVREENSGSWDTLVYLNGQSFGSSGAAISTPGTFTNEYVYLDTSFVGDNVIFEFYGNSGWGPDVFIDNFSVDFVPTCPDPVLSNTAITATSATFSWASPTGSTPLGSTIIWGPQGFYTGTGTPGTWNHGVSSPYTITGMSPNTFYDIYVIDSCGSNDFSGMVGPITIKTDCLAQLSGAYTIDANGTGANNFATLDSATSFLAGCGISGPVTFNMAAGTYSGSIALGDIIGGSSTNTVTFNGPTTGAAVINATAGQNAAKFDGTSYVTLNNLTLSNQLSHVVWLTNEAQHITINGCTIIADTVGTSSTTGSPIAASASATSATSYGNNASHITITNNVVKGGYYGIVANGASTSGKISDWTITGNDVSLQYYYNIRCYYTTGFTVSDNQCLGTRASGGYGVMMYYSNDFEIVGNNLPSKSYGLYLYYANVYDATGSTGYTPAAQSLVANNMVKGGTYGSYMYSPRYVDFYYNTFAGTTYGAYIGTTTTTGAQMTNLNMKNNIFTASTSYSVYAPTAPLNVLGWDYNLYYTGGASLAYYGSAYTTLSAWQTADSAINANSVNSQVTYMGADDLHLVTGANNLGTPITGITTDIDGDTRSTTTPDIGADEIPCQEGSMIPYFEDFNDEIPCNWSTSGFGTQWVQVDNYGGNQIDSTGFLFIDDDVVGSSAPPTISSISSPYFEASTYNSLTLEFDSYWRQYANSQIGRIEVYDGQTWVEIGALTSTAGSWSSPLHYSFDLSAYLNDSLSVRFTYDDTYGSGPSSWGYYWAIDNFQLEGNATGCPINVPPIVSTVEICGPDTVQLNASAINTQNEVIWLNASSQVVGAGNTYDLGYVTQDTGHSVALFAFEDNSPRVEFGPSITGLGGFGNFSNGTWFTANSAISLDSITVRANGNVNFKVNVYSANGGNASQGNIGNLLQSSDVINVGSGDSKVPVDLLLTPGNYFLNFSFLPGTTGALYRTITGANYPYSTSFMSIDSVQYPSGVRAYYAFDWVVRKGCVGPSEQALVDYHDLPTPSITSATNSTNLSTNVELTASGPDNYQYLWDDLTNTAIRNVYPSQTTSYWVIATDSNGCQASDTIVVNTVDITFQVDLSTQPVNTSKGVHLAGNFNGWQPDSTAMTDANGDGIYTVTVGLVAGDSTIQYKFINGDSWSDPHDQVSGFCSVNATGDRLYAVPFTNDTISPVHLSSCTIDQPVDVLVDVQPTVCYSDTVILDAGTSVWNVVWNTGDTSQTLAVTQPGTYWFSANYWAGNPGITVFDTTVVNHFAMPDTSVTASGSLDFCLGSSVTLSAASGQSYMWNTGDTTQSITATQAGSYYAVVTTSNGCSDTTATYTTSLYADPDLTVTASGSLDFCLGSSVTLSAASGQSYMWNTGDTTQSITATQAGSYYAVVTTSNGCSDTTATYTTSLYADPDLTVTASGSLDFCLGSSVTLSAASGQSYLWNTGDTTQSITATQAGSYYAVVTTSNGCSDTTATYTTSLYADPDTTVTASQTIFCASESATISAAGGYDYLWNTGDTTQSIAVITAGGYYVTLTSSDGCSATSDSTMITVVPDIVLPQITSNGLGWVITGSTTGFSVPVDTNYTYQWGIQGGSIQFGQGTDSIAVLWGIPDSNVAVWVVISNGVCSDSVGISINISGIGTDEGALQNVRLFPNPNDGYFTIEVGEAFVGASYEIVDGMGRPIERGEIQSQTQAFDLADKPKGVYRIVLQYGSLFKTLIVTLQ